MLEGQANWRQRDAEGYLPAPPHDETGHTWHHPDSYLFLITKYGIEEMIGEKYPNNMPAYEDKLTDDEIIAALSYIKSTWPNKVKIAPPVSATSVKFIAKELDVVHPLLYPYPIPQQPKPQPCSRQEPHQKWSVREWLYLGQEIAYIMMIQVHKIGRASCRERV